MNAERTTNPSNYSLIVDEFDLEGYLQLLNDPENRAQVRSSEACVFSRNKAGQLLPLCYEIVFYGSAILIGTDSCIRLVTLGRVWPDRS